jgi:hypothetical protein
MSNNNNNENSKKIIELKQSNRLKQTGLVTNSVYYIDTQNVKISLNHSTCADIIFTIDSKKWQNNLDTITKMAEENGIYDKESKQLLKNHLNDNHEHLVFTTAAVRGEESQEEDRKSLPQILVELVLRNCVKLFKDEFNEPHIIVTINDHYKTLPINSTKDTKTKSIVIEFDHKYYPKIKKIIGPININNWSKFSEKVVRELISPPIGFDRNRAILIKGNSDEGTEKNYD